MVGRRGCSDLSAFHGTHGDLARVILVSGIHFQLGIYLESLQGLSDIIMPEPLLLALPRGSRLSWRVDTKWYCKDTIQVELTQTAGGETRVDKTKSRHFYLKVSAKALMVHS